ncbi:MULTISPECIES: DUF2283 domain-containing protein [Ferroplasma]
MKIQYDIVADTLYIYLTNLKIVDTIPDNKNENIFLMYQNMEK